MTIFALYSAKGAPGTTTAAMLIASLWHRPTVLADCDPAGGDVALRLPDPDGRTLHLDRGILSLLPLARRPITPATLLDHAQPILGGGLVLAGLGGPEQAAAAGPVWPTLANAFAGLGSHDVVVDVGRLDVRSAVLPLVHTADFAVCVLDAGLPGVFAARARLRTLLPELARHEHGGPRVGFVVRAEHARDAEGAAAELTQEFSQLAYLGHVPEDPTGARIFTGELVSRPERTLLVRAGRELVDRLGAQVGTADWVPLPRPDAEAPASASGAHRALPGTGRRGRRGRERETA
jgi:hypothetical protein